MADRITDALRGNWASNQSRNPFPGPLQTPTIQPQQDGTAAAGYVTPDLGPFECENCTKFQPPNLCGDPRVQQDPEVQGQVDPQGCCNFFQSAHNETQGQEQSEAAPESDDEQEQ